MAVTRLDLQTKLNDLFSHPVGSRGEFQLAIAAIYNLAFTFTFSTEAHFTKDYGIIPPKPS